MCMASARSTTARTIARVHRIGAYTLTKLRSILTALTGNCLR